MKNIIFLLGFALLFSACLSGPERAEEMALRQALKTSLSEERAVKENPPVVEEPKASEEEQEPVAIEADGKLAVTNTTEEDEAQLQREIEAENAVIDASFALADFYYQNEEWAKAVKMYESILERKGDNFMALNNLFAVYEDKLEKKKLAAKVMDTMQPLYGANIEVTRDALRIYLKTEQVDKAEKALKFFESKLSAQDRLAQEEFLKTEKNRIFRAKAEKNAN